MIEVVSIVESYFGIRFKRIGPNEYQSLDGCPFCGDDGKGPRSDRFRLFMSGAKTGPHVWCRKCGKLMFVDEMVGNQELMSRIENIERRQEQLEERIKSLERAVEEMRQRKDHLIYHENLEYNLHAVDYWLSQGINPQSIADFKLGYCPVCPTAPYTASYTIPITAKGVLYNIRHRLIDERYGKYRPHIAGLPAMLFNVDDTSWKADAGLIVEGEKKAIVVRQELKDWPVVGIMGAESFKPEWVVKFNNWSRVYICLDPDAKRQARKMTELFKDRGHIVTLPVKADDFFTLYGGSANDFLDYIRWAK